MRRIGLIIAMTCVTTSAHGEASRPAPDALIAAHVARGAALWHRSCPVAEVHGTCVEVSRIPNRDRCGDPEVVRVVVRDRDDRLARRARRHFQAALSQYDELADDVRTPAAHDAAAAARYYLAEPGYERMLSLRFPTGLSFDPKHPDLRAQSLAAFKSWVTTRQDMLVRVTQALTDVIDLAPHESSWRVRAYARIGQAYRDYVDALVTAEIPADLRSGPFATDTTAAYCDALHDVAAPLDERAVESFDRCAAAASRTQGTNHWKQLCAREKRRGLTLMPSIGT